MKSYFQPCHYCGFPRPLNELENSGNGFVTCKDGAGCLARVGDKRVARLLALTERFEKAEQERTSLILEIKALKEELGLADTALFEHKAELARIEAGEAE